MRLAVILLKIFNNSVFIRFVAAGVFCAGIEFVLFNWMIMTYNIPYLYANFISLIAAVFINYLISISIVFKKGSYSAGITFTAFVLFTSFGIGLNQFLVWILFGKMQVQISLSKFLAIGLTAIFNFLTKKYIVFRQKV